MKVRLTSSKGLCLVVLLGFVPVFSAVAQDKAPKKAKVDNIQGLVREIKKDTSTISVDTQTQPAGSTAIRQVVYSPSTTFMYGHSDDNKPGTLDKIQPTWYISCAGTMSKGVLMATDCVYRERR
jgi:hypothetical protein